MAIKRNDPCLCGSGKKYKKCCMKNENVIQFQEVKAERFFQLKHGLVLKMRDFIEQKISFSEYIKLKGEFHSRSEQCLKGELERGFVDYWLHFFHRFENGLRGIEWFYQEQGSRLRGEEKELAKKWTSLMPKVIQAMDLTDEFVLFEEIGTKEQFKVPRIKENIGNLLPWFGTISLIEPLQDMYYFNGVRSFKGPKAIEQVEATIQKLIKQTDKNRDETLLDYFPEVLAVLNKSDVPKEDRGEQEVKSYILTYNVLNEQLIEEFFLHPDFVIDEWAPESKVISWVENWKKYTDGKMTGAILIADVFGMIQIEANILTFTSYEESYVRKFQERINQLGVAITFMNKKIESYYVPYNAKIKQMISKVTSEETPEYFVSYAQLDLLTEMNIPIPKYGHLSLTELVASGRREDAELWLRQTEFNTYYMTLNHYEDAQVTADFNSVRKQLKLPLSPFVTGGKNRSSSMEPIDASEANPQKGIFKTADIPFYEEIGFIPKTATLFFANDLLTFFKEKTKGKSEGTVRKYRNSLWDLREILEYKGLNNWNELDEELFECLIAKDYVYLFELLSKTQIKDFLSTIKAFAKWLDRHKHTEISPIVIKVSERVEPELIRAMMLVEKFVPQNVRRYHPQLKSAASQLSKLGKHYQKVLEGTFKIVQKNKDSIRVHTLSNQKEYILLLPTKEVEYVDEGMILCGEIGKVNKDTYEIATLSEVYPASASNYF